jgi:uncharacterized membrane protein (Fun14 family)
MTSESLGFLFPGAGSLALGGIMGVAVGYAIKKIFKIAVFVLGCFFAGIVWLSYKGLVSVNWNGISNQTQEALTNVAIQTMKVTNQTAQQLQHNGFTSIDMGSLLPVVAGAGFLPGFFYGLTRG